MHWRNEATALLTASEMQVRACNFRFRNGNHPAPVHDKNAKERSAIDKLPVGSIHAQQRLGWCLLFGV